MWYLVRERVVVECEPPLPLLPLKHHAGVALKPPSSLGMLWTTKGHSGRQYEGEVGGTAAVQTITSPHALEAKRQVNTRQS